MEKKEKMKIEQSQGLFTFMDVLGWKGVYYKDPNAIEKLIEIYMGGKEYIEKKQEINKDIKMELFIISDTIILLTYNKKLENDKKDLKKGLQLSLHAEITAKIINKGISNNILIRGATSYGKYSFSENELIFMGEAIDEAAEWHENVDWCGVILTPKAQMELDLILNNEKNMDKIPKIIKKLREYWINYNKIPLKSRNVNLKYALKWSKNKNHIISKLKESGPYTVNIAGKYLNTIEFIEYIECTCKENNGNEEVATTTVHISNS